MAPFLCGTLPHGPYIKFDGHEIIITRPGTDMMTAYRKASDRPNLILRERTKTDDDALAAEAFQAAVAKARELGWIV